MPLPSAPGLFVFLIGVVCKLNFVKRCGTRWWARALAIIPVPAGYRSPAFIPLIILGYLVPGYIFKDKKSLTTCLITERGKRAFAGYLEALKDYLPPASKAINQPEKK